MIHYFYIIFFIFSASIFASEYLQNYQPLNNLGTHVKPTESYIPRVLIIPSAEECRHQASKEEVESCSREAGVISNVRFLSRLKCNKFKGRGNMSKLLCKWSKNVTFVDSLYGSTLVGYSPIHEKCHLIQSKEAQFPCIRRKAYLFGRAIYDDNLAKEIISLTGENTSSEEEIRLATETSLNEAKRRRNCFLSGTATVTGVLASAVTGSKLKEAMADLTAVGGLWGMFKYCNHDFY